MSVGDTTGTIQVTSPLGFDTKYLFPGLFPHIVGDTTVSKSGYSGEMDYYVSKDGIQLPSQHFHLHVDAGFYSANYSNDIVGDGMTSWTIDDLNDTSHAQLANVLFTYESPLDGTILGGTGMGSMSMATPDALQNSFASVGRPFYLHIIGNVGNDTLRGSDWGNETLDGGHGVDSMIGGGGNDTYYVDNKSDKVVDSSGAQDYVYTTVSYTLPSGIENLLGTSNADLHLTGNSRANSIEGANGDDLLKGMDGGDSFIGFGGRDTMTGGSGNDTFLFMDHPSSSTRDEITDFTAKHDHFMLQGYAFGIYPANPSLPLSVILSPDAFWSNTTGRAHDISDRIIYNKHDGKLYWDPDGTGGQAHVQFATIDHHPTLHNTDFTLFWG